MNAGEEAQFNYDSVLEHKEELRQLEDEIKAGTKGHTMTAIAFGEAFLKAKKWLEHGMFLSWCRARTCYSQRKVEMYMNLAELNRGLNPSDQEALCHLCSSAACELARPSVDKSDVKEILSRAINERLTVEFVKAFVRRDKTETKSETQSDADEAAPDSESLQSVATFLQVLEPPQRESLWQSLRGKPESQDQRFMKSLRSLLAKEFSKKPR